MKIIMLWQLIGFSGEFMSLGIGKWRGGESYFSTIKIIEDL
jgi:hypothetical protein